MMFEVSDKSGDCTSCSIGIRNFSVMSSATDHTPTSNNKHTDRFRHRQCVCSAASTPTCAERANRSYRFSTHIVAECSFTHAAGDWQTGSSMDFGTVGRARADATHSIARAESGQATLAFSMRQALVVVESPDFLAGPKHKIRILCLCFPPLFFELQ